MTEGRDRLSLPVPAEKGRRDAPERVSRSDRITRFAEQAIAENKRLAIEDHIPWGPCLECGRVTGLRAGRRYGARVYCAECSAIPRPDGNPDVWRP